MNRTCRIFTYTVLFGTAALLTAEEPRWSNALEPELLMESGPGYPVFTDLSGRLYVQEHGQRGLIRLDIESGNTEDIVTAGTEELEPSPVPGTDFLMLRTKERNGSALPIKIELLDSGTGKRRVLAEAFGINGKPRLSGDLTECYFPVKDHYRSVETGLSADLNRPGIKIEAGGSTLKITDIHGKSEVRLTSQNGLRWLYSELSQDGKNILMKSVGGNILIYRIDDGTFTDIGPGNAPKWAWNDSYIIFIRVEDDGHDYTGSEIFVYDMESGETIQLTNTEDTIELDPAWSPDGKYIVYSDYLSGNLYMIDLFK